MKIKQIELGRLFTFGPRQVVGPLKQFNILIGPNGTGKTNLLRIIDGLQFNYRKIAKSIDLYQPEIPFNLADNLGSQDTNISGILRIGYSQVDELDGPTLDKEILFEYDVKNPVWRYIHGDVQGFSLKTHLVNIPNDLQFMKDLTDITHRAESALPLLNFGLFFIFGAHFTFYKNGRFTQGRMHPSGPDEIEPSALPSGVRECAKLITSILRRNGKPVLLFDEPELHLEPRVIRRLFTFIFWLMVRGKQDRTTKEEEAFCQVQSILDTKWPSEGDKFRIVPPTQQHISWLSQIFVASHSPVLINLAIELEETAAIFEFSSNETEVTRYRFSENGPVKPLEQYIACFTTVREATGMPSSLLDGLGAKGSDLLQTNGVIWVEGPSDCIYIRKWLKMYAIEKNLPLLVPGIHFDFQMYGGSLLDSISLSEDSLSDTAALEKLVAMFRFSRNALVVIDSDAVRGSDGKLKDKSKFQAAKTFIKTEFEKAEAKGQNIGLWYPEKDEQISTIENYLDAESLSAAPSSLRKKPRAQRITSSWSNDKKISDFAEPLAEELRKAYTLIAQWND